DHEAGDDAMEDHVVVVALLREVDEVRRRLGRALVEQLNLDFADLGGGGGSCHGSPHAALGRRDACGLDLTGYGLLTVTRSIATGSSAGLFREPPLGVGAI